jgi:hypothetical protein
MRSSIVVLILAVASAAADTEIHRCLLDDGTFAFQEVPCSEPAAVANDDNESEEHRGAEEDVAADESGVSFVNPFDQPANPPADAEATVPEPMSPDRAECEKMARDAIDAIDLEMRETAYTREQGQEYVAELLELTQALRLCKAL